MRQIQIDDFVRLNENLPEYGLHYGEVGVVRVVSLSSDRTFEVEFHHLGRDGPIIVTLLAWQFALEAESLFNHDYLEPGGATPDRPAPRYQTK
jgi:Domain of unknown function (DUF4926)